MSKASELLQYVNADNFEVLYRCRWSADDAESVVPQLVALLDEASEDVVCEALRAIFRIGPAAFAAMPKVAALIASSDSMVAELAVGTLGRVCLDQPGVAIDHLSAAAERPELQKTALYALINFGPHARTATAAFVSAYQSSDAVVRRFAVRGLIACGADDAAAVAVLERAKTDRSKDVRKAAGKRSPST
jgi:hypothetical protein